MYQDYYKNDTVNEIIMTTCHFLNSILTFVDIFHVIHLRILKGEREREICLAKALSYVHRDAWVVYGV